MALIYSTAVSSLFNKVSEHIDAFFDLFKNSKGFLYWGFTLLVNFLFSSHVNIVISCSNYKLCFIKQWSYFILFVLPNSKHCNSQPGLNKTGIPLEKVLVLCLLLISWCVVNCCSDGQYKKGTPVQIHIYILNYSVWYFILIFIACWYCLWHLVQIV